MRIETDKKDRDNYARIAINAKEEEGVPFSKTAKNLDISGASLHNWIKTYSLGKVKSKIEPEVVKPKQSRRSYAISDKIENCKKVIEIQGDGEIVEDTAVKLGIPRATLYKWMKKYKAGEWGNIVEPEDKLINRIIDKSKTFDAVEEPKTKDVMFYTGDLRDKNYFITSIERPQITDPDKYNKELEKRVRDSIKWTFVPKGFDL